MIPVLIESSHFTNAKTESPKEKVICPRSYCKTVGKLGFLGTHKSTSLYISREETQVRQNITRTWGKFKISPWPRKVSLYIQWNTARKLLSPHQEDMRILRSQEAACQELGQRWRGELYLTMEEFLSSVSEMKQTISCLFSRTRERSAFHWPAIFVAFLLQKQEALFNFTSVQG